MSRHLILIILAGIVVLTSCLEIDVIHQQATVAPNDVMTVTVDIHSQDTDPNPHAVFFTVLVPNDWEVLGVQYNSAKFGSGDFLPSRYWADSCEIVHPSGTGYIWHGFITSETFLADEEYIPATLTCTLRAGTQLGDFRLGYTLGEDALGYDTSWGNVYDYSFDNPVKVVGQIQVPRDYPTIQQAMTAADSGMIIYIAPGTYVENLALSPGITLAGELADETIVDGNGQGAVIQCASASTIKNLILQNSGPGFPLVQIHSADNVVVARNQFQIAAEETGIWIEASKSASIDDNSFVGSNSKDIGVFGQNCELIFRNNVIESAETGLDIYNGSVNISRNLIVGAHKTAVALESCPAGNFYNNTLSEFHNGFDVRNSNISVFNNIIVNGTGFGINAAGAFAILYNDVWNNTGGDYLNCDGGEGAISADPLFSGGDSLKYGLSSNSPCIDAGNPDSEVDPDGTIADLGAFHFSQPGIASSIRYIYLVHFTHLDIGFTDPQDVVADQYKTIIDEAINYIENIPTYKWTIESIWQLEQWLKRSSPSEIDHFRELVHSGRMDMCAGYATMHSATLGTEELNRFLYPAEKYRQEFGFELNTIYQNDVPGYAWAMPSALANAGVKYMATGINDAFGGGPKLPREHNPFYWQGPDGSRVLTWISYGSYIEWHTTFQMSNIQNFYEALSSELAEYEAAGYPYDAIMIMVGKIENTKPGTLHTGMTSLWNKTYANPKLIVARPEDFFIHLEEKYGTQFETYRGDWSGGWDHISLNTPQSMGMNRTAHNLASTAEKLSLINLTAQGSDYPFGNVSGIYENMLQFDEHSGGGTPWPGLMTYDEAQHQSEIAFHYAKDAYDSSRFLVETGLANLEAEVRTESPSILVFNPLSWNRTDVVKLPLNNEWLNQNFSLIDASMDSEIAFQKIEATGEIMFTATDVPSVGYKTYTLVASPEDETLGEEMIKATTPTQLDPAIENNFYRIEVSSMDGIILSIYDKKNQRELVNSASEHSFNGCIKANGAEAAGGRYVSIPLGVAQVDTSIRGDVAKALVITRTGTPIVRTEIWLYNDIDRLDIVNTADRDLMDWVPQDINFEYYAYTFPFDLPNFEVRLEGAHGFWNPATDHLPGAPRGYFAIQHGGAMSDGAYSINWANREAFVGEFEKLHGLNAEFNPTAATLISRFIKKEDEGMFADGSVGAIIGEPGASPLIVMHYSFCGKSRSFEEVQSARFNWAFSNPLLAELVDSNPSGIFQEPAASFFNVAPANVMLVNAKQAEDGNGAIFRLLELGGTAANAALNSDVFQWNSATVTDGVENDEIAASVTEDGVQIPLIPHEVKTVRANFAISGVSRNNSQKIQSYQLFQNYPNPFNPKTTIGYHLPQEGHVKIQVYNVNGQLVRALVDTEQTSGFHVAEWDGLNSAGQAVSSGVYFYRMQVGEVVKQRKLLLLK